MRAFTSSPLKERMFSAKVQKFQIHLGQGI